MDSLDLAPRAMLPAMFGKEQPVQRNVKQDNNTANRRAFDGRPPSNRHPTHTTGQVEMHHGDTGRHHYTSQKPDESLELFLKAEQLSGRDDVTASTATSLLLPDIQSKAEVPTRQFKPRGYGGDSPPQVKQERGRPDGPRQNRVYRQFPSQLDVHDAPKTPNQSGISGRSVVSPKSPGLQALEHEEVLIQKSIQRLEARLKVKQERVQKKMDILQQMEPLAGEEETPHSPPPPSRGPAGQPAKDPRPPVLQNTGQSMTLEEARRAMQNEPGNVKELGSNVKRPPRPPEERVARGPKPSIRDLSPVQANGSTQDAGGVNGANRLASPTSGQSPKLASHAQQTPAGMERDSLMDEEAIPRWMSGQSEHKRQEPPLEPKLLDSPSKLMSGKHGVDTGDPDQGRIQKTRLAEMLLSLQ